MGILFWLVVFVVVVFIIHVAILAFVYNDANDRHMDSPAVWILLVFFLGLLGLIIYLIVRNPYSHETTGNRHGKSQSLRCCPYCAEEINKEAVFCKHCHKDLPDSTPDNDSECEELNLRITGNDTITDTVTGLIWLKDANVAGKDMTWDEAKAYVENLKIAQCDDWRLPNVDELKRLVKIIKADTSKWLGTNGFMNIQDNVYWTASDYPKAVAGVWVVYWEDGSAGGSDKSDKGYIWAVRGYQRFSSVIE